jgi:hypothetical protein
MTDPAPTRPTQPLPAAQAEQGATHLRCVAPKDLSNVSLIPKWSGTDSSRQENAARTGNWTDADQLQVCSKIN